LGAKAKKMVLPAMAEQADLHELYEESVQAVDVEVEFLDATFKELRGRRPLSFREDFCGTASAACEWVRSHKQRTAIGVDNDKDTLDWGRENRVAKLPKTAQARVELLLADVRSVETPKVDIVAAFNFSYFLFKERAELKAYFERLREVLNDDGVLFLDCFGGPEGITPQKEKTKHKGFTYIWDQAEYEPVTGRILCHIHFKFADGSRIKKAFTYDWRLYSLPELRDILLEAGFAKVRVYWEGEDEDGGPDGEYRESATGDADPAWVCYVVAEK
jgi:SAM-dependent methyltransferase